MHLQHSVAALAGNTKKTPSKTAKAEVTRGLMDDSISGMRRTFVLLVAFVSAGVLFIFPEASHAQTKNEFFAPNLNVPIPGLNFQDYPIVIKDDNATIPFFSAYVGTLFNYLTGITVVVTAIMIVYGGFMYIAGSTTGQIVRGKEIIRDALIGLFLVLGSYTILFAINPETLSLKPPTLAVVQRTPLEIIIDGHLVSKVETIPAQSENIPVVPKIDPSTADIEIGKITECPFEITSQPIVADYNRNPYTVEFFQKTLPLLHGTREERLVQAAEIAQACKVNLSACGAVAGALWALAGFIPSNDPCLLSPAPAPKHLVCTVVPSDTKTRKKNADEIWSAYELEREFNGLRCLSKCNSKPDCAPNGSGAVSRARSIALNKGKNNEDALEVIRPGDWIVLYSGNTECNGLHSLLFIGWSDKEKGQALIAQGDVQHPVNISTRCFLPKCGFWSPITRILRSQLSE